MLFVYKWDHIQLFVCKWSYSFLVDLQYKEFTEIKNLVDEPICVCECMHPLHCNFETSGQLLWFASHKSCCKVQTVVEYVVLNLRYVVCAGNTNDRKD